MNDDSREFSDKLVKSFRQLFFTPEIEKPKKRYADFKANPKFCKVRYLNTETKKGLKQEWYNPNILHEIDKHYTKK